MKRNFEKSKKKGVMSGGIPTFWDLPK